MALIHTQFANESMWKLGYNITGKIAGDPLTGQRKGRVILLILPLMLCIYTQVLKKPHLGTKNLRTHTLTEARNFFPQHLLQCSKLCYYFRLQYGKETCNIPVKYDISSTVAQLSRNEGEQHNWVDSPMEIQREWDYSSCSLTFKLLPDVC